MSYNGSGTFQINSTGQPVVSGTVISSTAFNALTADLATGLSTAITKDGQTATTARIPFAQGISSTLVTDSTSTTTGSIITAGGAGVAKALFVGTTANVAGAVTLQSTLGVTGITTFSAQPIFSSLTASSAVATDASKGLVSVTNTGTGNNVLATSPTLVTPVLGAASATSVTVAAGAVGTPSITTAGDTNTGIFFPAADTIAFAEGGAEAMRIDSSGRVGIGTTSPTGILNVKGTGGDAMPATSGSTQSAGLVTRLQQGGGIGSVMDIGGNGGGGSWIQVTEATDLATNYNLLLNPNGGNLLVGTTSGASFRQRLYCNGFTNNGIVIATTDNASGFIYASFKDQTDTTIGSITRVGTTSVVSYATSSDYRLKESIAPMTGALAKVALLKPCTYKWKADGSDGQGFIAHELDEVVPGCVTGEKDAVEEQEYEVTPAVKDEEGKTITKAVMGTRTVPKYQGIDTSFLVATLTAAIQEQQALIQALTTRITALEAA